MASTPQTSASYSSTSPAISSAYQRIGGATPMISSTGTSGAGPKLKSIKDSLMEREKARRDVDEELNPWRRAMRLQTEMIASAALNPQKPTMTPEEMGRRSAESTTRENDAARREGIARQMALLQQRRGGIF